MTDCSICTKWQDEPYMRIAELEHCQVLLNPDQFFPGYTFVVTKEHVTELFHLNKSARSAVVEEVNSVAAALYAAFRPDKINYELLGNMMPHIHWHIVPRWGSDPLWPRPIWSEPHEPRQLEVQEYRLRIAVIRENLRLGP